MHTLDSQPPKNTRHRKHKELVRGQGTNLYNCIQITWQEKDKTDGFPYLPDTRLTSTHAERLDGQRGRHQTPAVDCRSQLAATASQWP